MEVLVVMAVARVDEVLVVPIVHTIDAVHGSREFDGCCTNQGGTKGEGDD